jgi:hypothetical protein
VGSTPECQCHSLAPGVPPRAGECFLPICYPDLNHAARLTRNLSMAPAQNEMIPVVLPAACFLKETQKVTLANFGQP